MAAPAMHILMAAGQSAAAWTPASLTPYAWYDADDAATFTYSSGVVVSQWNDKSGNGYHLTQGDTAKQPSRNGTINSRTSVVFDGTADALNNVSMGALTKPVTFLLIAKNTAAASQRDAVIFTSGAGDGRIFMTSGGTIDIYQGAFLSTSAAWGTSNAHNVVAVFNGASSKIAYDSNSYVTGTAGTTAFATRLHVGAFNSTSEFWQGDICEFVVVNNSEISAGDLTSWNAYAAAKWGTP